METPQGAGWRVPRRALSCCWLLALVYLVGSLTVTGSFLVAEQASDALASQLARHASHTSVEFTGGAGEDGGAVSLWGPERLRGALEPNVELEEILELLITSSPGIGEVWAEYPVASLKLVLAEAGHKEIALLPQLLTRPPPFGG